MVNRVPQTKGTNRATINRESRYYTHAEVNTQRHAEEKGFAPSTLRRSSPKAPRTFAKTHDSAAEHDGSEQRACRGAYAAVRHSFEKVGDHWEPKEANGPPTSCRARWTTKSAALGRGCRVQRPQRSTRPKLLAGAMSTVASR